MTSPSENQSAAPASGHPAGLDATATAIHEIRSHGPDVFLRTAIVTTFFVMVWTMLMPVLLGGLSAIVLAPLRDRIARRLGRAKRLAPGIVTSITLLGFLLPVSWVAWNSMIALNQFISATFGRGLDSVRIRLATLLSGTLGEAVAEASLGNAIDEAAQRVGVFLTTWLGNLAKSLPEAITNTFLFILALYFALRDGPKLVAWLSRISPVSPARTVQLFSAVRLAVNGTMIGMLVVAIVQGALATIALLACQVPNPFLWGFIAAICSVLPIVGTTPVTLGAAVWLYLEGRPLAALAMVISASLIGVSDNVVRPWVLSSHDDMHPLIALLAIFGGLALFGPSGLLVGPVIASMALWALETYRDHPHPPIVPPAGQASLPAAGSTPTK